jgi:ApaG protein
VLRPGEAFEYTSHAQLKTSSGIMQGSYEVVERDNGKKFEVKVPTFSLDNPYEVMKLN